MNKFIKYIATLGLLISGKSNLLSQQLKGIYIGQRADSIETFVGQEVQTQYNAGGYLVKMNAQTIDYKGRVKEVILCKENVLIPDLNKGVKFCTHYVMSGDTLSSIAIHYINLTFDEAKYVVLLNRDVTNMGGYYFDRDYRAYTHVYLSGNRTVIAEYKKTILSQIPPNVREQLRMIAGIW